MKEKILTIMEKNSRISLEEIAVLLGVNTEDVARAVDEMERDRVICGYHTIINWAALENSNKVSALIEVKVTPQRGLGFDKIAERIYNYPEVDDVYLMSGGFDLAVIIEGSSLQDVAFFVSNKLSTLDYVISTATHFMLKKYKDHGTILDPVQERERILIQP